MLEPISTTIQGVINFLNGETSEIKTRLLYSNVIK